jgi:hypothetical protein
MIILSFPISLSCHKLCIQCLLKKIPIDALLFKFSSLKFVNTCVIAVIFIKHVLMELSPFYENPIHIIITCISILCTLKKTKDPFFSLLKNISALLFLVCCLIFDNIFKLPPWHYKV